MVTTIEPTVDPATGIATLINVFVVRPERQDELVTLLDRATVEVMRRQPGFISANLHASADGTRVVNYAQWESEAAFQSMLADPTAREHMGAAASLAESFEPHLYAVRAVHHV